MKKRLICNKPLKAILTIVIGVVLIGCSSKNSTSSIETGNISVSHEIHRVDSIKAELFNSQGEKVLVVAHRGDWRNAPENSIQAIKNCISMGVDMVEIDIRKTRDNQLVVIHDKTLDRTTTGTGKVSDWTLDSLKTLYLKNGLGRATGHKIPTLEEAMLTAKDQVMINLDKCYDYFEEAYHILEKTGTTNQVVIKGVKTVEQVKSDFGQHLEQMIFMPIIHLNKTNAEEIIRDYHLHMKPVAMELVFSSDTVEILNQLEEMRQKGSRAWVNTLWSSINGGHHDDRAIYDLRGSYDWVIGRGITMIQTDRPQLLLNYLRKKGLHD